ncbi:hypothetical protein [Herminiimonas contaminans]|uniref:Uncharacterized protein n=1 Tax=Herminiimonas contaminans TaxID=1111140 RepID=A0ABS0EVP9_9BURK|nr:hypothetical protein [Herminiimonas contaminans]MBF8178169.1 hypothetical protein [Herminiimonas contaminans]
MTEHSSKAKQAVAGKPSDVTMHTHDEELLDDALEATFPASDPVAEMPHDSEPSKQEKAKDELLDTALDLSFPASDPISVTSGITRIRQGTSAITKKVK